MFWGLREFRAANLLNTFPVQQTTVTVECSGRRISKTIKSLQKRPNFESLSKETDIDRIRVVCSKENKNKLDFFGNILLSLSFIEIA